MSTAAYRGWGIGFAVIGILAFSLRPILIKLSYAAHPVSPTTLLFLRMSLSLPFFLAIGWWLRKQEPALTRRDWLGIVGLGFLGYYAASFLDFIGLQWVGAGVGRLILYLFPTLVVLLSFVFLQKKPGARELVALAISYAGIVLVVSSQLGSGGSPMFAAGAALVFASALCYAVYLVVGSQLVKRVGSMRFTAYSTVVATVPAVIQFLILEAPAQALTLPTAVWGYAIVLATFSTVLPLFLQAEALNRIGANHFAMIGALGPVSVAITSALGLDEPFTAVQAVGAALVIFGVLLVTLKKG